MRNKTRLKALYLKARAFFQANPSKWGKHKMYNPVTDCFCYSGAMAVADGTPVHSNAFNRVGFDINDATYCQFNSGSIIGTNDYSESLEQATERLDKLFEVTA